jgi:isocitrate lyase
MFELAREYKDRGMAAYAELQEEEFANRDLGYGALEHQAFVGTEYFDQVAQVISAGTSSTLAMEGSTEREQITNATRVKNVASS